jgi:hypothetical protein
MIAVIDQVPSGNALRLVLQARGGATLFRVTRGATELELEGPDAGAIVYEGSELSFLDTAGLVNGQEVWYRAFYMADGAWRGTPAVSQTPRATFADYSADPLSLVRDRLVLGLAEIVRRTAAGDPLPGAALAPRSGSIPVLVGTPLYEGVNFPLVVMHLVDDTDQVRGIGEGGPQDAFGEDTAEQYEGWYSRVQLSIVGWSKHPSERKELRKALKALVIANLPVFDAAGLAQVSFRASESDDTSSYPEPLYQVLGTFTCLAPSFVGVTHARVADVSVIAEGA